MTLYHRWTETGSQDLASGKNGQFPRTFDGMRSRQAFRVFKPGSGRRPSKGVQAARIAPAFDCVDRGTRIIEDTAGQARHPVKVVQRRNERGAFGVGAGLPEFLQPARIRLADRKEIAAAPGVEPIEATQVPRMAGCAGAGSRPGFSRPEFAGPEFAVPEPARPAPAPLGSED